MDVFELIKKLDGYVVTGQAIVRVGGKHVMVGRLIDDNMVFTPEGKEMAKTLEAAKPKRATKKADESEEG